MSNRTMNGDSYYGYQSRARGISCAADVQSLARLHAPTYSKVLSKWLPADRGAAIYEVACGPGIFMQFLRDQGYHNVSGSDSSAEAIAIALDAGLPAKAADSIQEMRAAPTAAFQCVVAIDFIEHLPKDVLIQFLAEVERTLAPAGCLILRIPNGDSPLVSRNLFNDITHYWAYTTIASRALLTMAGFSRVQFTEEGLSHATKFRLLKLPAMIFSRAILSLLVRAATRERVEYWESSLFVVASKQHREIE